MKEEQKVAALVTGSKIVKKHLKAMMKACVNCEAEGDACFEPTKNPKLKIAIRARRDDVSDNLIKRIVQFAKQGYKDIEFDTTTPIGIAKPISRSRARTRTTPVRVTDEFLNAVETDGDWKLLSRLGSKVTKTIRARDLWEQIGYAAWASADPGIQFHTTINDWHTCPAGGDPRLKSVLGIHVPRRHGLQPRLAEPAAFRREDEEDSTSSPTSTPCRLWTIVLEISVLMAQFPSRQIAELSYRLSARSASATPTSAAC